MLIGYGFSGKFEAMGEVIFQADRKSVEDVTGTINFGIRYKISEVVKLIASTGTGFISPDETSRIESMSFAGIQFNI